MPKLTISEKVSLNIEEELHGENLVKTWLRNSLIYLLESINPKLSVGKDFRLGIPLWFTNVEVNFGNYCYLGPRSNISNALVVGDLVLISSDFRLIGNDHGMYSVGVPMRIAKPNDNSDVQTIIESEVWIGQGVTVLAGVKIGRGSIVAANSFVNKDVEPYTIVGGVPARKIKSRFNLQDIVKHEHYLYDRDR